MNRRDFIRSTSAGLVGAGFVPTTLEARAPGNAQALDPPYPDYLSMGRAYFRHVGHGHARTVVSNGLTIAIGDRDGARVQDAYTGDWFWDCHRVGSLHNLGHAHPVVTQAVSDALVQLGVGNGHYLSGYKAAAAEKLVASTDGQLTGVIYAASGSEANEAAIKAARGFSGRRRVVAFEGSYHGHTGLMIAAGGSDSDRARYLMSYPDEFERVPFNDIDALDAVVDDTVAAVLIEPLMPFLGFEEPAPGYFADIRAICNQRGAAMIVDDIIAGLGSTGTFWSYQQEGVLPDIVTTAKGLGGGVVPNAAALLQPVVYDWFASVYMPHQTSFGGNELGCVATSATCDVISAPGFLANVQAVAARFEAAFAGAPFATRGRGLCIGLVLPQPRASEAVSALFDAGVLVPLAITADILQLRPPLILTEAEADEIAGIVLDVLGGLLA